MTFVQRFRTQAATIDCFHSPLLGFKSESVTIAGVESSALITAGSIAENALALGKADIARDALGVVRANWKEKDLPDSLSAWMKRLDAASGEKAAEPSARN
jgi:hypothetical protein